MTVIILDNVLPLLYFTLVSRTVGGSPSIDESRWHQWWTYEGISGPSYWGAINKNWALCKDGRQQSPINIEPAYLLYDPNLKHLDMQSSLMTGTIENTGHDFTVDFVKHGHSSINISLGPLSYTYRATQLKFHLANADTRGSEHLIAGKSFPVEMHVVAYNCDLYENISHATSGVKGIAIIAVFMEIGKEINKPFYAISKELEQLKTTGQRTIVYNIDLKQLLPKADHYITYDGSLTQPGCQETVTWIILNKPVVISPEQIKALRWLFNGVDNTNLGIESNTRPVMPLNHRVVRTNINTRKRSRLCTMEKEMFYQVNEIYLKT